eukprot:COSAG05_NODE_9815_length_599_cov_1.104000_1_plen_120_part_10
MAIRFILLLVGLSPATGAGAIDTACAMRPVRLRTNNLLSNPLGVSSSSVKLSWALEATGSTRGLVQSAYHVRLCSAADCDSADIWDSGKVASAETLEIAIPAKLSPTTKFFWKVEIFDAS